MVKSIGRSRSLTHEEIHLAGFILDRSSSPGRASRASSLAGQLRLQQLTYADLCLLPLADPSASDQHADGNDDFNRNFHLDRNGDQYGHIYGYKNCDEYFDTNSY